jgi:hypothetical protein
MGKSSSAPQCAEIQVSANGVYTISTESGIKLVRDLFEGIGVDRLRADRYFANLSFSDVSELDDADLTEAIAVGFDYMTDPLDDRSAVKEALFKRMEAQFPHPIGRFVFRVGDSYSKIWPKPVH